jgi:hypothetical protein
MRLKGRRKHIVDQVDVTYVVKGSQIVVEGIPRLRRVEDMPITGGTGRYAGARGTPRVTETRRAARLHFTFIG